MKILVVGAGISGCVCPYQLSKAGHDVVVIEKGRGVGGRMAARRVGGARIDHGPIPDGSLHEDVGFYSRGGKPIAASCHGMIGFPTVLTCRPEIVIVGPKA